MAIVISRSAPAGTLTGSTSFVALNQLAGSTVSSSFTVPQGVSAIKQMAVSTVVDGAGEECGGMIQISGNAMKDGASVFITPGQCVLGTSTGANTNFAQYDTDLAVVPGNSLEIAYAQIGSTAAADVGCTLTFE